MSQGVCGTALADRATGPAGPDRRVGLPGAEHLAVEAAALRVFDGRGAVRLLAYDAAAGALLLERAEPGTLARGLLPAGGEAATAAAISVLHRLHVPIGDEDDRGLPPAAARVEDLTQYLARHPGGGPLPRHLVTTAAGLFAELSGSATARAALHGDLHHDNVLAARREPWLAIDPHGLVGDPCYDVGSWMYKPEPGRLDPALTALVPARCEQFADGLGQPLDRVTAYAFVVAVLSEVWTVEDGGPPDGQPLAVARLLLPRLT